MHSYYTSLEYNVPLQYYYLSSRHGDNESFHLAYTEIFLRLDNA